MKKLDAQDTQREHHQKKNIFIENVRIYIAAALMILPSLQAKSDEKHLISQSQNIGVYEERNAKESVEVNEELLFRSTVSEAVRPINNLKDIPVGGIQLKYPVSYKGNLPKSIDFFPKEIQAEALPYTIIRIGEKMFVISPDLGFVVDKMYLDKDNFYVHVIETVRGVTVMGKEIAKSKEDKEKGLPEYLAKLYFKGTTVSYKLSTVREVPKAYQAQALQALEKINVKKVE